MAKAASNLTYNRRRAKRSALAELGVTSAERPRSGNNVSHAHNKTKRLFRKNLQTAKVLVDGKLVSVRVPASTLRTLTKQQKELEKKAPKRKATGKQTANAKKPAAKKPTTKKAAPKATAKK
jgi:ribosomal protein L28